MSRWTETHVPRADCPKNSKLSVGNGIMTGQYTQTVPMEEARYIMNVW